MDSQQTPRTPEDPVAGRGSSMVKQNSPLSPGFQARHQAPQSLPPRYPINNGSSGGPRPGVQQPQTLNRLDSRSSLGSPAASGGPFVQSRPPFGPPRSSNPQGNPIQQTRSPNPTNPQIPQGSPRYPTLPGSPGIRPVPSNFVGPRPPIFNPNQQQQIYYQPRNGEIRFPRPIIQDPSAQTQIRPSYIPQNPEIRQHPTQGIPETLVTSPTRNDWPLRDERANSQTSGPITRPQGTLRQFQQRERMELTDGRSPIPGGQSSEIGRGTNLSDNDNIIAKQRPLPRGENEDDDDDVVMDNDKDNISKSREPTPRVRAEETSQLESVRADSPGSQSSMNSNKKSSTPSPIPSVENQDRRGSVAKMEDDDERPASRMSMNSYKKSATPSPIPPAEHEDRSVTPEKMNNYSERPGSVTSMSSYKKSPTPSPIPPTEENGRPGSVTKVENNDEPPGSKLSASPIPSADKSGDASRSESRLEGTKSPDHSINDDSKDFEVNETILRANEAEIDDTIADKRNDSRASSVQSTRSPVPPRTPDNLTNLSVPPSPSSQSFSSPKSPLNNVKGFDNGQLRSVSSKSPTPSVSPQSPNSPSSVVKSAENERKKATFADNTKTTIDDVTIMDESSNNVKSRPATPGCIEPKGKPPTPTKIHERAQTPGTPDGRKSTSMKRSTSGRSIKSDAGSESGANQTDQPTPTTNGVAVSPTKKLPSKSRENDKRTTAGSPVKSPSKSVKSLPRTPEAGPPSTAEKKKVPMNKVQVGAAPSPNLKTVRSKIGSLDNASYKPGGGKVKIENRKLDFSKAQPKIAAKNDKYTPSGGDKKQITQVKLQWNAKPKVGSLDNATYKPGGGDKKIEMIKLDFKDKAKPKVGSKDNAKHVPGGGTVKSSSTPPKTPQDPPNEIETQKIDIKAESKIGSLDNVKHKPGGGDKKIFNDRDYLRQTGSNVESLNGSGAQIKSPIVAERPTFIETKSSPPEPNPPPTTPTRSRPSSAMSPLTPRALRSSLQAKTPESPTMKKVTIAEELQANTFDDNKPSSATSRKSSIADGQMTPKRSSTPRSTASSRSRASSRSPSSSRPPSSLDIRISDKTPSNSRKSSPKGIHLPKLTSTPSHDDSNEAAVPKEESKIKLPKLMETSTLSSRVELAQ